MVFFLLFLALWSTNSYSHSGRTNADGCHTNHSNGSYHCHNAGISNADHETYCLVLNKEKRCGYAESTCKITSKEIRRLL
ncbi:MAG: YHYH domain-containing protein [Bdellovibrionota bacterium]